MKKRVLWGTLLCFLVIVGFGLYSFFAPPLVSVVLSTYNRAEIVSKTIESVLNQTSKDFEFIIINDGSTDNTAAILNAYAKKDPRIRIITNTPNQGLIASLNKGLNTARGKYIARIDDDDRMFPERLEKQVVFMDKNPKTAVTVTGVRYFKDGVPQVDLGCPTPSKQVLVNMHFANGIIHSSAMFRTSFFNKNNVRYNKDFLAAEDYKLWQDVLWNGGEISCIQTPLTEFEPNGGHSLGFYRAQADSAKRIKALYLSKFFDNSTELIEEPPCFVLDRIIEENKTKKILDDDLLQEKKVYDCKKTAGAYYLVHPNWQDYLIPAKDKTKVARESNDTQTATILSLENDIITLKWDGWGIERFKCNANKRCGVLPAEER